jgi:hypothetical protein
MSSKDPSINDTPNAPSTESKDSAAPLLKDAPAAGGKLQSTDSGESNTTKPRKRDFWKLGKKPEEDRGKGKAVATPKAKVGAASAPTGLTPVSPMRTTDTSASTHPYGNPSSPGLGFSSSPRPHSPAASSIFERNVQEEVALPEKSPHLPTHVLMENHIAPALDASAEAITNEKLDPDTVEIVTHATHQPAAVTISGLGQDQSMTSSMAEDFGPSLPGHQEAGSTYGSLDSSDVRRLSFISFADVVHGEQEHGDVRRDSTHLSGHPSLAPARSPSPIRSPVSSAAPGTSPPTSYTASVKGFETSPHRAPRGTVSPVPGQSSPLGVAGNEINVETMRQALRKTGSGDLSHFRSPPLSAVGNDDGTYEKPFGK